MSLGGVNGLNQLLGILRESATAPNILTHLFRLRHQSVTPESRSPNEAHSGC